MWQDSGTQHKHKSTHICKRTHGNSHLLTAMELWKSLVCLSSHVMHDLDFFSSVGDMVTLHILIRFREEIIITMLYINIHI